MSLQSDVPLDATHYFLWWDGLHIYKKESGKWYDFINGRWVESLDISYHKIKRGLFCYYLRSGDYKHKLYKVTWTKP